MSLLAHIISLSLLKVVFMVLVVRQSPVEVSAAEAL